MEKIYPFKFLNSYLKKDKDIFFGRKEEVDQLYKMIFKTDILVVYGTSGTGKTSLIQCGLANKFRSYDWLDLHIRRGTNIINSLNAVLDNNLVQNSRKSQEDNNNSAAITDKIEAVYNSSFKPIYLIFDQFEELFLIHPDKLEQKEFLTEIQKIRNLNRQVKTIFIIREEYLGFLYDFEKKIPGLLKKKLRVEAMDKEKVGLILKGINELENSYVTIEQGKIDQITEKIFVALKEDNSTTIQLPYLQVYLDNLYKQINQNENDNYNTDVEIKLKNVKANSKLKDVMQKFLVDQVGEISNKLEKKYKGLTSDRIWSLLSKFVTIDGTKEPMSVKELISGKTEGDAAFINDSVKVFKDKRILRLVDDDDLYELSHDSLALKILERTSAEVIKQLEVKSYIKNRASEPDEFRKPFDQNELNKIELYLNNSDEGLGKVEKDFIRESERIIENEKRKEKERLDREKKEEIENEKREYKRKRKWIRAITIFIIFFLLAGGFFLQKAFLKSEIANDNLLLFERIRAAESKIKEAVNVSNADPTLALLMHKETKVFLDTLDSLATFKKLKNRNYGPFSFFLRDTVYADSLNKIILARNLVLDSTEQSSLRLLQKDDALYKIIDFKKDPRPDNFSLAGEQFLNMIFANPDTASMFKIWSANDSIVRKIHQSRDSLKQMVFPIENSEAMALYENGSAEFIGNNKAYKELKMDEVSSSGVVKIMSIAPINYEVIGYKLLSVLSNKKIVEWNLNGKIRYNNEEDRKGRVVYEKENVNLGEFVHSIAISRNRDMIFTATEKGIGVLWPTDVSDIELINHKKIAFSLEQDTILCSSFSRDGSMIITGSKDHTAAIWCSKTGKLIKKLKGHSHPVTSVAISAKNKFVYTGSSDGTYRKWILPKINCHQDSAKSYDQWHNNRSYQFVLDFKKNEKMDIVKSKIYGK